MTTRKTNPCAICENSNLASICPVCVNFRLNEYNCSLKVLKSKRDALYSKLTQVLVAKGKADDQHSWRVLQNEKLARLRNKLRLRKAKIEKMSHDLKVKYEMLESAMNMLEKNRVEQIEKYYPNLICTQSLGHMAITSERLHKQSVIIKQICKLFPQRRVIVEGRKRMDTMAHMIQSAMHACQEAWIPTRFHLMSLQPLWVKFNLYVFTDHFE
ncbi:UNVERIFIED_CONTAM: hypothetical protein Slati_2474300 [Sesamum latifolium]|uniref:Uncharacterized protein n=1 Tax=Sesamum latifolium TaxID=2727402 RepID=A0AAW2WEA4_9LAMI